VCTAAKLEEKRDLEVLEVEIEDIDWETKATITDKCEVVTVKLDDYRVRVFEKDGRFAQEFELYGGPREACKAITFNSLTKEIIVVSRVEKRHYLSTYLLKTGKRCHYSWLSHIGQETKPYEIYLTSHVSGSIVLITDEHALYIQ
jgi:hypothetical protein